MNGTMQNRIHDGTRAVMQETSDDCGNRHLPLTEFVDQLAEHRARHGQRDRLHGRQRARQRIVAVVMLHGNRDRHADHWERHAGDYRSDGESRGVRYAKQLRIPSEKTLADVFDADEDIVGHACRSFPLTVSLVTSAALRRVRTDGGGSPELLVNRFRYQLAAPVVRTRQSIDMFDMPHTGRKVGWCVLFVCLC